MSLSTKVLAVASMLLAAPAFADVGVGDSIAVGTSRALHIPVYGKERKSSCWILQHMPLQLASEHVVISAGVNDAPGPCVGRIRARVSSSHVCWIRPINGAGHTVDLIAAAYGDRVLLYKIGADHLHPASYAAVASDVHACWK